MKRTLTLCALIASLPACANFDSRGGYVLGEATARNIALQSPRDVTLPNIKAVETISGTRAARNVKALNEGKTKVLAESGVADAGEK